MDEDDVSCWHHEKKIDFVKAKEGSGRIPEIQSSLQGNLI